MEQSGRESGPNAWQSLEYAEAELEGLYLWVMARAPQQGAKWFNDLERAVLSLDQHPKRCPVAPERIDPDQPVR